MQAAAALEPAFAAQLSPAELRRAGQVVANLRPTPNPNPDQARELQYHLQGVLAAFAVVVRAGKGYVEARPKGIDKD